MSVRIITGDCREVLATLDEGSVQACVTSPPYFGLRDYGHDGQMGLEPSPDAFVAGLVGVFRAVRRVLADDGTLWLNLGDSYARTGGTDRQVSRTATVGNTKNVLRQMADRTQTAPSGLKDKDIIGIPWRVAFALQADGWYLRQDIVWHKPNPMPESVTDRCTKAHEYVFLLTKSARYYYDAAAISEEATGRAPSNTQPTKNGREYASGAGVHRTSANLHAIGARETRNARSVWTITTKPFKGAHFATFPPELAERCILAGSRKGDTVLDPFSGAGTTAMVADRLGRSAIGIELNPEYATMSRDRVVDDAPLFAAQDGAA